MEVHLTMMPIANTGVTVADGLSKPAANQGISFVSLDSALCFRTQKYAKVSQYYSKNIITASGPVCVYSWEFHECFHFGMLSDSTLYPKNSRHSSWEINFSSKQSVKEINAPFDSLSCFTPGQMNSNENTHLFCKLLVFQK